MSRKSDLAIIHIIKNNKLDLDDDLYQQMLQDMFGVDSSAVLDDRQRRKLIARLNQLAGKYGNDKRKPSDPMARKIRALWLSLHKAGIVHDSSDDGLNKYVMRQTKVRAVDWLNTAQANVVIESLKKWKERAGLDHED